jgi:NADPH-dependent 2,4-dienoyl-CoA reductase/sulfur reductase-like enzyme
VRVLRLGLQSHQVDVRRRAVPVSNDGFVPVGEFSRVPGMAEHVFAAGDATNFPIKHGGFGAQQADVAAAGIAALAGLPWSRSRLTRSSAASSTWAAPRCT